MKIAIIGAGGRLGAALMREYRDKFDLIGFDHQALDLGDGEQLREKIGTLDVDLVVNCAALTNVDYCETHRKEAFRINAEAPGLLAKICRDKNAKLIHFSTDYVFDGEKREAYIEEDETRPISVYGESKRAGEENVLAVKGRHLIVRVSWVFGPDRVSFIDGLIKRAQENEHVDAIADKFSTPTYTHDVAEMLVVAGIGDRGRNVEAVVGGATQAGGTGPGYNAATDYSGILHFANAGECSWHEYGQWALDCCQTFGVSVKAKTVDALELKDMTRLRRGYGGQANWMARRPVYSVLSSARYTDLTGASPRVWREAVADYIRRFYSKT
jgi:dTDP-4-dehydrorhamnose reductase